MSNEKKRLIYSTVFPLLIVALMWIVKMVEHLFEIKLSSYGIYPLELSKLPGIVFSPFLHGDFKHLVSNSLPLFILGSLLFYFYNQIAPRIMLFIYIVPGILLWFVARPSYHIGASTIVYGLVAFLFFSGIIRKYYRLTAISLLVVFLYGSVVWGMFPIDNNISWEGHICGFITGSLLSVIYRNKGPKRKPFDWESEEYDDEIPGSEDNPLEKDIAN